MASKKKSTKNKSTKSTKNSGAILRCVKIEFEKKPKKDLKNQMLVITYETASGTWTQKKIFEDLFKFVEATAKSHKKAVGKLVTNSSKFKDEAFKKHKHENAFKMMKDVINTVGKKQKILSTDSKISAFIGAKRDHLNDIKNGQKCSDEGSKKKKKTKPKPTAKSTTFISDLGTKSKASEESEEKKETPPTKEKESGNNNKQEMDSIKRKHLSEVSNLKQENHNLKMQNETLKETNSASQEARQELEEKIVKYEKELGKDIIGDDIASIFADEFKKQEDPAEKYYQRTKEQQKRIDILEAQLTKITKENGDLKTKLERAKYVADHLATEVTELHNPDFELLEQDYKEVEAELDEITQIKEEYEVQMAQTAKILDELELETAKMRPHYEEYPKLVQELQDKHEQITQLQDKYNRLQSERDDFEDKLLKLAEKGKDLIPKEQLQKSVKSYKEQIKELNASKAVIDSEKEELNKQFELCKQEMAKIKIKLGELEAENARLLLGGGKDINLEINLDFENDFSIFGDFEYPQNISRDQLILWCDHFKLLIREINEELCAEINTLSRRNDSLENYIESSGLPFPEDTDLAEESGVINDLPHPLPSMNFINDLDQYNPTKQQLTDYIDLMFTEWRRDEVDHQNMLTKSGNNHALLAELELDLSEMNESETETEIKENTEAEESNDRNDRNDRNDATEELKKKLENAYLKQEEVTLELNKKIETLSESNEQLSKQLRTEQQKSKTVTNESGSFREETTHTHTHTTPEETGLLNNRLSDTEQYVKDLTDEMRKLEFETAQQKQALEREYQYEMEIIKIDLEESRTQCDDLERQLGSDDLNLLASEFRTELWDARNDCNDLKKKHIEEVRQLERDRDELLREINLLRIKTDRMDMNSDEVMAKMQTELDQKDQELQHFVQVTSKMDAISEEKNALHTQYKQLNDTYENEKQVYKQDIQELNIEKKKLIIRIKTAEEDIKSLKQSHGIDSEAIITKTELVNIKQEMDDLKMRRTEAIKSKIRLLQTSSLEIERMRDEIKLLTGDRKVSMRDFTPGRYDSSALGNRYSVSSFGSNIPSHLNKHTKQKGVSSPSYLGSAWNYTVDMLSSVGSVFRHQTQSSRHHHNHRSSLISQSQSSAVSNDREYDIHTEYDYEYDNNSLRSSSILSPQLSPVIVNMAMDRNKKRSSKRYSSSSRMSSHRHNRGPSSAALRAKKHKKMHSRKLSRHKRENRRRDNRSIMSNSHNYNNGYDHYNNHSRNFSQMSTQSKKHRGKQPSKQEILLDAEENDNIRDSMAKIFDAFEAAEDNVTRQSMDMGDISGVNHDDLALFSLDNIGSNDQEHEINHQINQSIQELQQQIGYNNFGGVDDMLNNNQTDIADMQFNL